MILIKCWAAVTIINLDIIENIEGTCLFDFKRGDYICTFVTPTQDLRGMVTQIWVINIHTVTCSQNPGGNFLSFRNRNLILLMALCFQIRDYKDLTEKQKIPKKFSTYGGKDKEKAEWESNEDFFPAWFCSYSRLWIPTEANGNFGCGRTAGRGLSQGGKWGLRLTLQSCYSLRHFLNWHSRTGTAQTSYLLGTHEAPWEDHKGPEGDSQGNLSRKITLPGMQLTWTCPA